MNQRLAIAALWALRGLLLLLAAFHLVVGLALWLSHDFQSWAVPQYLSGIQWSEQSIYLVRIVGSFAAALGVFALLAIRDPWRDRHIVFGLVVFFVIRNCDRLVFYTDLNAAFGTTWAKNMQTFVGTSVVTVVMLACLWMMRPR